MGRQAFRRRKSDGTLDDGTGGGANTDGAGFKFTVSNRVPMMNGNAGNITNTTMNSYWAYGNLISFLENKTLDKAWIYINSLSSGSAGTGVTTALYELADSVFAPPPVPSSRVPSDFLLLNACLPIFNHLMDDILRVCYLLMFLSLLVYS